MKSPMESILWALAIIVSIFLLFEVVGVTGLVRMFPEGRRWWILPLQYIVIGLFAVLVLNHPF